MIARQRQQFVHGSSLPILRDRTAMKRTTLSRPIALAIADGLVSKTTSVFDFGCGHGSDIRFLRLRGITISGWDPHYRPDEVHTPAAAVNLGYVLNVIEDPIEREQTLRKAFSLAKHVLIVAVRVENILEDATLFSDGIITQRGTFQKIYTQVEFRQYLETTLQRRVHVAALGIAYVFCDEEAETRYVGNRAFTRRLEYRTDLIADFKKSKIARNYVRLANRLGRLPLPNEFPKYSKLIESFGSPKRVEQLTLSHIDQTSFEGSRTQRREDILTYLAMLKLDNIKPPGISKLPASIQSDIKAIWKNYSEALVEGEQFLFSIGKPEVVANVCAKCSLGKRLPFHLYVHRTTEDELPALLRLLIFAGKEIVGEVPYDLVKFATDGRAISFLQYQGFDEDPHPALVRSVKVFLPKATYGIHEYLSSPNPPILHRKETFVLPSYIHFEKFRKLTEQEDELGLLSSPDIGYRRAWEDLLQSRGVRVEGHNLYKLAVNLETETSVDT